MTDSDPGPATTPPTLSIGSQLQSIDAPISQGGKIVSTNRPRQSLGLLTRIELRKFFKTDAGFALPAMILLFTAVANFGDAKSADLENVTNAAHLFTDGIDVATWFLPLIGAVIVTGEFSSRLAVTTFTLTPRRGRIIAAKLATSVLFALTAVLIATAFAVVASTIFKYAHALPGGLQLGVLAQSLLLLTLKVIFGIALGAMLLHTAPAVVATFAGPALLAALLAMKGFGQLHSWLNLTNALSPFSQHLLSAQEWAHAGTAVGFWILLPLLIGIWRVRRHDF